MSATRATWLLIRLPIDLSLVSLMSLARGSDGDTSRRNAVRRWWAEVPAFYRDRIDAELGPLGEPLPAEFGPQIVRQPKTTKVSNLQISPAEASRRLGVSDQTIRNWIACGRLKATRTRAGYWQIDEAAIERLRTPLEI